MADLQAEWAGVLQRWGNSTQAVETETTVTVTSSGTNSQDRQQSNSNYNKYDSLHRQEKQSSSANKYESHDTLSKYESHGRQSAQHKSVRQHESHTERQNTRDRQERETVAGGKTGGRQRWSSVSRGSVSPGKENCDSLGYR